MDTTRDKPDHLKQVSPETDSSSVPDGVAEAETSEKVPEKSVGSEEKPNQSEGAFDNSEPFGLKPSFFPLMWGG